jgi:hypothetical protein
VILDENKFELRSCQLAERFFLSLRKPTFAAKICTPFIIKLTTLYDFSNNQYTAPIFYHVHIWLGDKTSIRIQ